jgi:hypothetical protein
MKNIILALALLLSIGTLSAQSISVIDSVGVDTSGNILSQIVQTDSLPNGDILTTTSIVNAEETKVEKKRFLTQIDNQIQRYDAKVKSLKALRKETKRAFKLNN